MARDIKLLHPTLRPKVEELIQRAKAAGIDIIITQTLRSKAEQDAIYAQGRTAPGNIVTKAQYPQSLHCWGVAFDFAVMVSGKVTWNEVHYVKVGPIGEALGLEWGGRWQNFQDLPHFQLPGYSWSELLKQYGTPEAFIKTWKEDKSVAEVPKWKLEVMEEAVKKGIIDPNKHKPDEPADKAFVLAVVLNTLKGGE